MRELIWKLKEGLNQPVFPFGDHGFERSNFKHEGLSR